MNFSERQHILQSALDVLSGYKTMQCGQIHENVVEILPVDAVMHERGHDDHPGWKIQIKGLCSRELRNKTLGCSHSMTWTHYSEQLRKLISHNFVSQKKIHLDELDSIIVAIYKMDHQKGHLEKELAVLKKDLPAMQSPADKIAETLNRLRQQHVELVNRLESIHQQILFTLREMLDQQELLTTIA